MLPSTVDLFFLQLINSLGPSVVVFYITFQFIVLLLTIVFGSLSPVSSAPFTGRCFHCMLPAPSANSRQIVNTQLLNIMGNMTGSVGLWEADERSLYYFFFLPDYVVLVPKVGATTQRVLIHWQVLYPLDIKTDLQTSIYTNTGCSYETVPFKNHLLLYECT